MHTHLRKLVEDEGKLLDPRDLDANETTREEFVKYSKKVLEDYKEKFDEVWLSKHMGRSRLKSLHRLHPS